MKLPANVLALCLLATAGCETAVDFDRRSAPPAPTTTAKGVPERIEIVQEQPSYAQPPPAAAPITRPPVAKKVTRYPAPKPVPAPKLHACGPCGMG